MTLPPFEMERWQSLHEHRVEHNLSESGVRPYTLHELEELTGQRLDELALGYTQTNGTEILRERVAALHPGATPDHVLVTTGGAEANFLAMWHLVEPGDRVVVLVPAYGQTEGLARGFGAEVRSFRLEEDRGWQPAPGAAGEVIEDGTKLVVVTHPNNPTGAVLSDEAMEEIAAACERTGAWLLADEVYAGAEAGRPGEGANGAEGASGAGGEAAGPDEGLSRTSTFWGRAERTLVTGSLSKAYGLPGLRLGWVVGPPDTVERLWGRKDYTTIAPAAISDRLAATVLAAPVRARVLRRTRRIVRENLAVLTEWLDARPGLFRYRPPDAGAILYARYGGRESSAGLAERLREDHGVLVVPGEQFGMERFLRIGFGGDPEELREALARVAEAVDR